MADQSARILFDSLQSAVQGLITVLEDARVCKEKYTFGGLEARQILVSGMSLRGDLNKILAKLEDIPGAVRYDD